jgi:alkylation response protein AidB-like acyl-CoA dehydrogenase
MIHDLPPSWRAARALEHDLGDPDAADGPFTFAKCVALDEESAWPEEPIGAVERAGFLRFLVPEAEGGQFRTFDEAMAMQRAVARRDLSVAIALGQRFLGSLPVWLGGNPGQRQRVAAQILSGAPAALALTEEEHGGDVLATETRATRTGQGWRLDGRKWLINNATRGRVLSVFARTGEGTLGAFTLFLLEKDRLGEGQIVHTPKIPTHGIRGADISGFVMKGSELPEDAPIGGVGRGLQITLHALQVTRIGCAGFSLGAADTALRTAIRFAGSRHVYGGTVLDLQQAAASLAECFVDLLVADVVATLSARVVHAQPEQLSVASAVTKALVPVVLDDAIRRAGQVLGARWYLREGQHRVFQKIVRDHALVPVFDGSTAVNLDALAQQLPAIHRRKKAPDGAWLPIAADWSAPLPVLDDSRFGLINYGKDDVTATLADRAADIQDGATRTLVERLGREIAALDAAPDAGDRRSASGFARARRYSEIWAAAACVHVWLHNREAFDPFFAEGLWLRSALRKALGEPTWADPAWGALMAEAKRRVDENLALGVVPLPLG